MSTFCIDTCCERKCEKVIRKTNKKIFLLNITYGDLFFRVASLLKTKYIDNLKRDLSRWR